MNTIPYYTTVFPSGCEMHVCFEEPEEFHKQLSTFKTKNIFINDYGIPMIYCCYPSADNLMESFLLKNALEKKGYKNICLGLPYIPYARQDRVCNEGESFSLEVFASIINSQNFYKIYVLDPHSDISMIKIKKCHEIQFTHIIADRLKKIESEINGKFVLVAPDKGAYKKVNQINHSLSNEGIKNYISTPVFLNKFRKNKEVFIGYETPEDNTDYYNYIYDICSFHPDISTFIIIDDILDGGKTIIEVKKSIIQDTKRILNLEPNFIVFCTHILGSIGSERRFYKLFDHFIKIIGIHEICNYEDTWHSGALNLILDEHEYFKG